MGSWRWGAVLQGRPARLSLPVLQGTCLGAVGEEVSGHSIRRAPRVAHAAGASGRLPPYGRLAGTAVRLLLPVLRSLPLHLPLHLPLPLPLHLP